MVPYYSRENPLYPLNSLTMHTRNCLPGLFMIVGFSCEAQTSVEPRLIEQINSAAVAFSYSAEPLSAFFQNPDRAYVSGYFYFEEEMAEDIIFGLDLEWTEGTENPVHFPGTGWMSLAGVSCSGIQYFPVGSPEN